VWLDPWWAAGLALLAVWILLSGLDDLFIDLVYLLRRPKPISYPSPHALAQASQRRIAVLVPLWREHAVIEQMLRHNLSVILYGNYDFFVGVYPNDPLTSEAVNRVARDDARVHIVLCSHDGPTSKGDCLNAIYEGMADYERRHGVCFEILIPHDAEDRIHPQSLHLINWFARDYPMVQIPVLPIPTAPSAWIHGLYCDEFAEFQCKDIPVRQALGGFLPANGVGTGFERSAAETLRRLYRNQLFDPQCLTEDYETGFRMYAAGFRQLFLPVHDGGLGLVATREYFPNPA
jgi:bacteriophage N4 adsorption protein B